MKVYNVKEQKDIEFELPGKLRLIGDIMIRFKYDGKIDIEELFRVQFNTAFIGTDNFMELELTQLCPENIHKPKYGYPRDFKVQLFFESEKCDEGCQSNVTPPHDVCDSCKAQLGAEYYHWIVNSKIIPDRPNMSMEEAQDFLGPLPSNIKQKAMSHKLKYEMDNFAVNPEVFESE